MSQGSSRSNAIVEQDDRYNSYIHSEQKQRKLYKKTLIVIILSQIFGGAGLSAGVTVGALLAKEMLGRDSFAGVPSALITLGSAVAALMVGILSQRLGRRTGLATGFFIGGIGAIGVVIAAVMSSLPLLFVSLFLYGSGTATNLQARYAGTDLARPTERAKAVSMAMVFTTIGAVAGPNLVDPMSNFAKSVGLPPLSGPFILGGVAFLLAAIVLFIMLRPDPFIVSQVIARHQATVMSSPNLATTKEQQQKTTPVNQQLEMARGNKRGIYIGATVMVITQIVMVAIMTMTPIHMTAHGHGLGDVGLVIGIHVAAMYLPSLITGILVDKWGRTRMSYLAGTTLLASGLLAAFAPGDSLFILILALALLGLGWNFGLISGTAQIVDATPAHSRAKTQGAVDVFIAIAGASGGALSGAIVAGSSYMTLSLIGAALSLVLIPIMIWDRRSNKQRYALHSSALADQKSVDS
ncbi:MFS transporter [Paenibacillus yanchengensis]|uniref:MFS transporter n=1 Tax=Paenibacillus yanchengensis TaxID=2035833 RepID=A0ABW4YR04_9BACL